MLDYSQFVPRKPSSEISTPALLLPQRFEVVGGFNPDGFDMAAAEWHLRKTFVQNGLVGIIHGLFGIMPSNADVLKNREFVEKLDEMEPATDDENDRLAGGEPDKCDGDDGPTRKQVPYGLSHSSLPLPLQGVDFDEAFLLAARAIHEQYKAALNSTILARQNKARNAKGSGLIEFANRYGFLGGEKALNRDSLFYNFAVIRAVDAIRILRKAGRLTLSANANKAIDGLIAKDEEALSPQAFESSTREWNYVALEQIVQSFGIPVLVLLEKCGTPGRKKRGTGDLKGPVMEGLNRLLIDSLQPCSKEAVAKYQIEGVVDKLLDGSRSETEEERIRREAAATKFEELRKKGFVLNVKEDAAREERIERRNAVENLKELVLLVGWQLSDPALDGIGFGECDEFWARESKNNKPNEESLLPSFLKGLKRSYVKLASKADDVFAGPPESPQESKPVFYNDFLIADAWLRDLKDFEVESSFWNKEPAA
ncbi:hypothetical protein OJ996_05490 [Luteolibacter sp. GHJ8]|uniref:Uncharacterized protein n=1 Tax=Luteolibacter rhizosphaerae TaxID=2989719 RepID=A0ABT3FZJ6_9BACT|nr:hypothetical protein [Luteolibacter rhizosphaerae]MCW1913013.1 hypothetical protein [Luteolibacter rhizosphaerae]